MSKLDYGYNIPALKGMKLEEIQTPCLLIDYETFKLNVEKMRSFTHENNIKLRPHAKMHKSIEVAKYQLQYGNASGICWQKLSEAEVFVRSGVKDILITNQITDLKKIDRLCKINRSGAKVTCCVDNIDNLNDFSNPIYSGKRVGKDFKTFSQFKLRSMSKKKKFLSNVTSSSDNDPRITSIGRFLRKTKFDEIPQLINILLGQMSFVGPRPNVVNEVEKYYNEEKKLLSVKPGITDFSSIVFSDEGEILSESKDPDLDYNLYIRFWKSSLGLIYIKHRSVKLYLYIVFLTIMNFFNREKTLFLISCS